jgi:hypothetical protein
VFADELPNADVTLELGVLLLRLWLIAAGKKKPDFAYIE